jgi:hypothetical protein
VCIAGAHFLRNHKFDRVWSRFFLYTDVLLLDEGPLSGQFVSRQALLDKARLLEKASLDKLFYIRAPPDEGLLSRESF